MTKMRSSSNPYQPPPSFVTPDSLEPKRFLAMSYTLAAYAVFIGWRQIPPFLTLPLASSNWKNWCFGFAPAVYLMFAAIIAVYCERKFSRLGLIWIPLLLFPLLAVSALILFATYIDFGNLMRGKYDWFQNARHVIYISLCPVVWYYFTAALFRTWRLINLKKSE